MTATSVSKELSALQTMGKKSSASSARYTTFRDSGPYEEFGPCFHRISGLCKNATSLAVTFMGYNGFKDGDRFREASFEDLTTDKAYPFIYTDKCHYNEYSLEWLRAILAEDGPFRTVLPHLHETDPEKVQEQGGFIFPDVQKIPASVTWCFLIASRVGVANARVLWTYLLLRKQGVARDMASLLAGGFADEVIPVAGTNNDYKPSGRIIKSYTAGWLGVDTTAYARRHLDGDPLPELMFKDSDQHTNGSAKAFLSGKVDMKNLRFDDWDAVVKYSEARYAEQAQEKAKKAA